jgi:hypothetical protein
MAAEERQLLLGSHVEDPVVADGEAVAVLLDLLLQHVQGIVVLENLLGAVLGPGAKGQGDEKNQPDECPPRSHGCPSLFDLFKNACMAKP